MIFFWQIIVLLTTIIYIAINSHTHINPWIVPNLPLAILITIFTHRFFTSALVGVIPITILFGLSSNENSITFLLIFIIILISGSLIIFPQKDLFNNHIKMALVATLTGAFSSLIYILLLMLATDDLSLISSLHPQILSTIFITGVTTGILAFALNYIMDNRKYRNYLN